MKKKLLFCLLLAAGCLSSIAQCGGGFTKCSLDWDHLVFYPSAGIAPYTNLARSQTQRFSFGTQRLTIAHNFSGTNAIGEDALNTAETGSFGTGADLHFSGDGALTVTFQSAVDSIRFSVYDVDYNQRITVTSAGGQVTLTRPSTAILGGPTGNGTDSATVTATTNSADNANTAGTVNVLIKGPVTGFKITASLTGTKTNGNAADREYGDWWVSDTSACSPGTFSSNFFQVAKPYTNQPGYVISVRDNNVYFVDPATGKAKFLFTDPSHTNLNSLAYDPVNHFLYYVHSLTGGGGSANVNNKTLRRYDYNMDTLGVVMADISTLLPTFESGVESGAAAFYDGALYLGVEADNAGSNKSVVWKIEFNGAHVPIAASQVYATPGAGHDWADIAVTNGMLYDFDGSASAPNYYHVNLYNHGVTPYTPAGGLVPRQASVDWNNTVYHNGQPSSGSTGEIAPYLLNGTINTGALQPLTYNGVAVTGSWGDAAEAFKPKVDFGDAPATYDPAGSDPAVHEMSALLKLGDNTDHEWTSRGQTMFANSDNHDDGLTMLSLVNPSYGSFYAEVRYLNNTGTTATICGWVDFNYNGLFDAGEGVTQTALPSSGTPQTVILFWNGVTSSLTPGSYTYVRIRITTSANGMTTANATGYFSIGEVEDFRLPVTISPLQTSLVRFTAAKKDANRVEAAWQTTGEEATTVYTLQRSTDARNWTNVYTRKAAAANGINHYRYNDTVRWPGTVYYRLRIEGAETVYSAIQKVEFSGKAGLTINPNPAGAAASLVFNAPATGAADIRLYDASGRIRQAWRANMVAGKNSFQLDLTALTNGLYWVELSMPHLRQTERLIIKK